MKLKYRFLKPAKTTDIVVFVSKAKWTIRRKPCYNDNLDTKTKQRPTHTTKEILYLSIFTASVILFLPCLSIYNYIFYSLSQVNVEYPLGLETIWYCIKNASKRRCILISVYFSNLQYFHCLRSGIVLIIHMKLPRKQ